MCSISGIISFNPKKLKLINKMIESQSHRAPDEDGFYLGKNISLGMGRLKIIDLKSKNLVPFYDDNFVLLFNGEIYNYIELKQELKKYGFKFRSNSDTEVLFNAWKKWGENVFEKLNGMYAFCVYDKIKIIFIWQEILLAKNLYITQVTRTVFFSSEAKSLKIVQKPIIKNNKFYDHFQYCFEKTLWKGVKQLKPAHYLKINLKK